MNLKINTTLILIIFVLIHYNSNAQETVTDIDGNVYHTVNIGSQTWMVENLKTTRYRNGNPIGTTSPAWKDIRSEANPKYHWILENDNSHLKDFGRLYTWYAATDRQGIAPEGWHVPTDAEWNTLINFLGGDSIAGGKLKEKGTTHWKSPNTGATNESGFTAIPGGDRFAQGTFDGGGAYAGDNHHYGFWWSSTDCNNGNFIFIDYQNKSLINSKWNIFYHTIDTTYGKKFGFSVRCIKDSPVDTINYLGQTPPGETPAIFAPGILSTSAREHHGPAISPDGKEIFWSVQTVTDDTVYKTKLMFSRFIENNWSEPAEAPFSHGEYGQPAFSPDGKNLYFLRDDSMPSGEVKLHIVCYTKQTDEWANPVTICEGAFPSIANNGTIYYCGLSGNRITGIFKRTKKDGIYNEPEKLPVQINNPNTMNWTPYIAPDESYIIFSRLDSNGDRGELMISFRDSVTNTWTESINIGSPVNTWSQERQPRVSPDGKYLFFSRWISDNNEVIFWVSSQIIERLKPGTSSINEKDNRNKELQLNLFQNYPNPFNPSTVISYQLSVISNVKLKIYNVLGQEVKTLIDSYQNAGKHLITWDSTDNTDNPVSSGVYFYSLKTDQQIIQKKMILLR